MSKIFPVLIFLLFSMPAFAHEYNINKEWFYNFNDDVLIEYIEKALNNNKDIKIAKKEILKYGQEKNLNISKEFPDIEVGANYLLLKVPKLAIPNNDIQTNSFALPFITVWELDYLGKNYNEIQKSKIDIENSIWNLKAQNLIVSTKTAAAYFNISNMNKQIELQNKITDIYKNIFIRKEKMFKYGVISAIELNLIKEEYLRELNELENLCKQREIFLTELSYLIGESPYNINEIKVTSIDNINYTGVYPDSLNGDIVLNRPDIMKIEGELKKAKIDITIAKKDFLPTINVMGILAFSTIVQNFNWQGALAALSAGAMQNLFDGGRRIFTYKKRKIEYEIMLENYLNSDLNALKEVNDTLYTLKKDYEIYKNNKEKLKLSEDNFIKIFNSYNKGAKSYVDYLDENSRNLKSVMAFDNSKNQNFINLLSLYKSVGGAL